MKDPYEVLGVSPNSDDAEIKKAYRELAKKYHPDNYVNNPLSDLAAEKMKEINEAYDTIIHQRANKSETSSGYSSKGASGDYYTVRQYIQNGNIAAAENILLGIKNRNAEWHYLKGVCEMNQGKYNDATANFKTAVDMDPSNTEYARMYDRFRNAQGRYGNFGGGMNQNGTSPCDICTSLLCADCLCECLGGDLISCC